MKLFFVQWDAKSSTDVEGKSRKQPANIAHVKKDCWNGLHVFAKWKCHSYDTVTSARSDAWPVYSLTLQLKTYLLHKLLIMSYTTVMVWSHVISLFKVFGICTVIKKQTKIQISDDVLMPKKLQWVGLLLYIIKTHTTFIMLKPDLYNLTTLLYHNFYPYFIPTF